MSKCIVIVGANGFLGRYLSAYFIEHGWKVRAISRNRRGLAEGVEFFSWDGETEQRDWQCAFDNAEVVVNLAGRTVNCRYNTKNKEEIVFSRVRTTELIGAAIEKAVNGPGIWLNSSTATIYRHAEDRPQTDEEGEIGEGFSVNVAKSWERAFFNYESNSKVRKVAMRTAIVMAKEPDTVLDVLANLSKKYLGGKMGSGKQMVSWVHVEDFCRPVNWMIQNQEATGTYNVSSPNPLSNAELMKLIRAYVRVSFGLPATKWMLEIGSFFMRSETELILKSRWVVPSRLLSEGFEFEYQKFEEVVTGG